MRPLFQWIDQNPNFIIQGAYERGDLQGRGQACWGIVLQGPYQIGPFYKGLFQVGPFEGGPSVRGHLDQACLQKIPNDYYMVEVVGVKMMRGKTDVTIQKLNAICHLWGHRTSLFLLFLIVISNKRICFFFGVRDQFLKLLTKLVIYTER